MVIDEQHKFGVLQRSKLLERKPVPDLLVMSATPIPRTLAMTVYGDLEVSILDEKPANRRAIITRVRPSAKIPEAASFIRERVAARPTGLHHLSGDRRVGDAERKGRDDGVSQVGEIARSASMRSFAWPVDAGGKRARDGAISKGSDRRPRFRPR